jgi:hypothetical protein
MEKKKLKKKELQTSYIQITSIANQKRPIIDKYTLAFLLTELETNENERI